MRERERAPVEAPAATTESRQRAVPGSAPNVWDVLELQRDAGNGAVARLLGGQSPVHNVVSGGGDPLPEDVREDMEGRLGHGFGDVRIHRDAAAEASARSVNARAYTVGSHVVFQRSAYAPETQRGRRTLAHELTHVVQQRNGPVDGAQAEGGIQVSDPSDRFEQEAERVAERAMSGPVPAAANAGDAPTQVQRCGDDEDCECMPKHGSSVTVQRSGGTVKEALENGGDPALVAALDRAEIGKASSDQRLQMIDVLNNKGNFFQRATLPNLWDTFGKGLKAVADGNAGRWQKSFEVAAGYMRASNEVRGLQHVFHQDVEDVAKRYLDQNDTYCKLEMQRLGLSEDGKVQIGPPTAEQAAALQKTRADAVKLAADQEAQRDLRKVVVGYVSVESPPGGDGPPVHVGGPATFDPERPPGHGPLPPDKNMKTWEQVKKSYDDLDLLIRARMMTNPSLFPLVRGAHEDTSKTGVVAAGAPTDALSTLGAGLKDVRDNIAKTRPMLHAIAPDLETIHGQLLAGNLTVAGDRNWKTSPFFAAMAKDIVEQRKPGPWWAVLGLAAAEMGAYVVAGIATGGTAIAIGLAAKGVANVAISATRANVLETAAKATATEETALISNGQVNEAKAQVIWDTAFAMLDAVMAAGAVNKVLRSVLSYEKVAAEAAAKAAVAAEKNIAKELAKDAKKAAEAGDEAAAAVKETRAHADEAAKAAGEAEKAAQKAGPDEVARANAAKDRAAGSASKAKQAADDLAALAADAGGHAAPRTAGESTLRFSGNLLLRCASPCVDLASSIAARAKAASDAIIESAVAGERKQAIWSRFAASQERASGLAQRSRTELPGLSGPAKIAAENRLLDEAVAIEHEVQGLLKMTQLESTAVGSVGKEWGDLVAGSVKQRVSAIEARAIGAGSVDKDLAKQLAGFEQRAKNMADDAARLESRPTSFGKPRSEVENDLAGKWKELDKALEGAEREELARAGARLEGGTSLGESDAAVRKGLGVAPGGKSPDIGRDLGGGRLLLSESKGDDIPGALKQFESGMTAAKALTDPATKAARYTSFDLRIYVSWDNFEVMTRTGKLHGFPANNVGGRWFIPGPDNLQVQILKP